jgi:putative acetyltransferase
MIPDVLPLRHASRLLVRELGFLDDRADDTAGLTHSQCHALIELEGGGPLSQAELAALLRLDKSRMSRVTDDLCSLGLARRERGKDARVRIVSITPAGKKRIARVHAGANERVERALSTLDAADRRAVVSGMALYAKALERSRRRGAFVIRPIVASDNPDVARLIRTVMPEFGASGPGYAIMDPEVDDMHGSYRAHGKRAAYWVVARIEDDAVVGAGGFAPLIGGDKRTCELRKMYFYSELRGLGLGSELLERCIGGASRAGFSRMYLETLSGMAQARALYERHGFKKRGTPLGDTGHSGCNAFYERPLGRT